MRTVLIIFLFFFIFSCEKNFEPLGDGEVYLETNKVVYSTVDSIQTYLINNSGRSVFSHPPGEWYLCKYINEEWETIFPTFLPAVVLPPHEWKNPQMLVFSRSFPDTGLFRIRMYLSWDKETDFKDELGWIYSNKFQIKIGT
jgi:hypothetical protein